MNTKQLRYAFNEVLNAVESIKCENLHHSNKQQHGYGELCPAEYHLQKQVHIIREYMKEQGVTDG